MEHISDLTLICHNVFWFQGYPFASDQPPAADPEVVTALCRVYRNLAPDIICLQEVQSPEACRLVSEGMRMQGRHCAGNVFPQYGGAVLTCQSRPAADYKTCQAAPQRMWQILEFDLGGGNLSICNIHLPSNRQAGRELGARQRVDDMQTMLACRTGGPDMIAGDFNDIPGGEVDRCLQQHGYLDTAVLTGKADQPTGLGVRRGDYVWIHQRIRDWLQDYHVIEKERLAGIHAAKPYLSDHLPLVVRLRRV